VKLHSAASARLPDFVEPMQAKLVDSMRPEDRIYEIKFDRCRALALLGGSETWILSPNQKDLGSKFTVSVWRSLRPRITETKMDRIENASAGPSSLRNWNKLLS